MGLRLAIACVALVPTVSAEQSATQSDPSASATAVVRGVIPDASTGRPIRGVEVRTASRQDAIWFVQWSRFSLVPSRILTRSSVSARVQRPRR